ncbi:MAG: hypothetical protein NVSMB14_08770 [Isosphaeraceae bacterium]
MAGIVEFFNIPATPLVAATQKTILQIKAPANQRVRLMSFGLFFDGVTNNSAPCEVKIMRQTTLATGTAATPSPVEPELTETVQASGISNATAEPTYGAVLETISIPTLMGGDQDVFSPGQEIYVGGAGYVGITCNAPAGVNVKGFVKCEE